MKQTNQSQLVEGNGDIIETPSSFQSMDRKNFLKWMAGAAVTTAFIATGCNKNHNVTGMNKGNTAYLGSGDVGILNYAYTLEQLEASFYIKVMANKYSGMSSDEAQIFTDLMNHEKAHRDFLKAALSKNAIMNLQFDFSTVDFTSRDSVLGTAKAFEDLGVSAYNGAGKLIKSSDYLLVAGKIVSVEARHASAIRDLIKPKTAYFAGDDVVNASGMDGALPPAKVLATAGAYIKTKIDASQLPTS